MDKRIVIPRKKSKSIECTIWMFLATLLAIFPSVGYFTEIPGTTLDVPLLYVVLGLACAPLCAFCFVLYLMQIFNREPVLTIDENGIHEQMNIRSVGRIRWEDIEDINIVPYKDHTYFICLFLKNPEKYIKNPKALPRMERKASTQTWGHVKFSSLYFKKEFPDVVETIDYYLKKNSESDFA